MHCTRGTGRWGCGREEEGADGCALLLPPQRQFTWVPTRVQRRTAQWHGSKSSMPCVATSVLSGPLASTGARSTARHLPLGAAMRACVHPAQVVTQRGQQQEQEQERVARVWDQDTLLPFPCRWGHGRPGVGPRTC